MKITEQTTLAELAVELGKYGVQFMSASMAPSHVRAYRVTLDVRAATKNLIATLRHVGEGNTLAQAIDDALARCMHRAAEGFPP